MSKNNNFANIVFVLGAGSSYHLDYPLGEDLYFDIINNFKPLDEFGYHDHDVNRFKTALKKSHLPSIDTFLEKVEKFTNDSNEFLNIGRVAIAQQLFRTEKKVKLELPRPDNNWYRYLWSKIHRNYEKLINGELAFITFNYDLSLEEFFYRSIRYSQYGYSLSEEQEKELNGLVQKIPIIHVYGKLGYLKWQDSNKQKREYGVETNRYIWEASQQIKIVRERDEISEEFKQAQDYLGKARRIYFLGFGYDEINLKRLDVCNSIHKQKIERIYGTTINVGEAEHKHILNSFHADIRNKVQLDRKNRGIIPVLKDTLEII